MSYIQVDNTLLAQNYTSSVVYHCQYTIPGSILGLQPANQKPNAVSHWLGTNLEPDLCFKLRIYVPVLATLLAADDGDK